MKVVILHQHFNTPQSGGPLRSYYLAKALIDKGHQVVVISSKTGPPTTQNVEGIEVHYLAIPYDNTFGFYQRGSSFIRYALQAYRLAAGIQNVSLCYAISVPITVGIPALALKWFKKIPFAFEVGDLWPDAPVELGFIKNPILRFMLFGLEKKIYREARLVVALSEAIKNRIEKKVSVRKIITIPNMADTSYYYPSDKSQSNTMFTISYVGAVGFANGLDHFLECARACLKAGLPVKFNVCGEGAFRESLHAAATRLNISNLSFVSFQNREGVKKLLNETDAIFVSYRPFPILETGSPNKYFDGLAAGKLILINFNGWIREEIEKQECGIYVDQRYPHEFTKVISPFVSDPHLLLRYQKNARSLAEQKYSRLILGEKFVQNIETL